MPIEENTIVKSKVRRVPNGWSSIRVGEITNSLGGSTPSTSEATYWDNGDILWATPTDITNLDSKFISDTSRKITETAIDNTSSKLFPPGTILMTSRATIGYPAITKKPIATNQGFINIETGNQIHNLFLYYWIIQKKKLFERFAQGSTFVELTKKDFRRFYISLPPYKEQEKIAEILSTVDADIEKTDAIIKEIQQLKKGLIDNLVFNGIGHREFKQFTLGPRYLSVNVPAGWRISTLGDIVQTTITYGVVTAKEIDRGHPMIRSSGLGSEEGIMENIKYISPDDEAKYKRTRLEGGEILMALVGATIGQLGLAPNSVKGYNVSRAVGVIRLAQEANPKYYMYYLMSGLFQKKITAMTTGSAQPVINLEKIREFPILIPPKDEQEEIALIISEVSANLENEQSNKSELKQLKKGLLQVLLTGKVRVKI